MHEANRVIISLKSEIKENPFSLIKRDRNKITAYIIRPQKKPLIIPLEPIFFEETNPEISPPTARQTDEPTEENSSVISPAKNSAAASRTQPITATSPSKDDSAYINIFSDVLYPVSFFIITPPTNLYEMVEENMKADI